MKKIKVQLDFNITKKTHSLYHSFFNNPPEGVEYVKSEFVGINDRSYSTLGKIYKNAVKIFPFVSRFHQKFNDILRKDSGSDLIHFTFHFGNTKKRCVVDYETGYSFINIKDKENKLVKNRMIRKLNKKNLKYLMPIHKESLKSFKLLFGDKVKKPQEIVYPTIFIPEEFRKPIKRKNRIIFISTSNILEDKIFLIKGGLETLIAFEKLAQKYPKWNFTILGKTPSTIKKDLPKNVTLMGLLPREEMWKMFNESKIFVQPCYQAPAMSFLEAMWFKLPIVTYNCWANDEYVDEKNGILINPELPNNYIDEYNVPNYPKDVLEKIKENSDTNSKKIEKAVEKLIKNNKLREKLGENGFNRVSIGKFSIDKKNEKLRKIYETALKN